MNTQRNITIRKAQAGDLEAVVSILNETILLPFTNGYTVPFTTDERLEWFEEHNNAQYPLYIAEAGHEIAGWLSLSPYRSGRDAFRFTKEISYYIAKKYFRLGIATMLVQYAIEHAAALEAKNYIAILMGANAASIGLLEKCGFEKWAFMPGVAEINGKPYDHVYYGKKLG